MQMNASSIVNQKAEWEKLGVKLPAFDHAAMTAATKEHPIWVHFGAGNIFRGFIAALQQRLLNEGLADRGIIAADTFLSAACRVFWSSIFFPPMPAHPRQAVVFPAAPARRTGRCRCRSC